MAEPRGAHQPAVYRIQVAGRLQPSWSPWFGEVDVAEDGDGTTSITGPMPDQAALHGLLSKVRDLGLTLVSVDRCPPGQGPSVIRQ